MLTANELKIMKHLWDQTSPSKFREIANAVGGPRGSVGNRLKRMEDKKLLRREEAGYIPLITLNELVGDEVRKMVDTFHDGKIVDFIRDYAESVSPEERMLISKLIAEKL